MEWILFFSPARCQEMYINHPRASFFNTIIWNLIAAFGYSSLGFLSRIATGSTSIALSYWPAAGLAVGLCLFAGYQTLPGIFIGSLLATTCYIGTGCNSVEPSFAILIASAATLQTALITCYFNSHGYRDRPPEKGSRLLQFLLVLGPFGSSVAALTFYSYSLLVSNEFKPDEAILWWLGDSVGSIVMLPITAVIIAPDKNLWKKLRPIVSNQLTALFFLPLATAAISKTIIQQGLSNNSLANQNTINQLAILLTCNELLFVILGLGFTMATATYSYKKIEILSRSTIAAEAAGFVVHEANQPLLRLGFIVDKMKSLECKNLLSANHPSCSSMMSLIEYASSELQCLGKITKSMIDLTISGARDTRNANVAQAINAAVAQSQSLIDSYNISLGIKIKDVNLYVLAGQVQLQTAIRNVIANACRAADHEGVVRIQAYKGITDIKIVVEDSGPGFQQDFILPIVGAAKIGNSNGMGIGLAIVRLIMDNCNGTLELRRSIPLGGACITMAIPIENNQKT